MSSTSQSPLGTAPFDHVLVTPARGAPRRMSANEFMALPLDERIGHILRREAKFMQGEVEIDRKQALAALRVHATAAQ